MIIKKLAIFFDGTWANKDFVSVFKAIIVEKNSLIAQLYNNFQGDKLYSPGPGTSNQWSEAAKNWLAGASGDVGEYGVQRNVDAVYAQILTRLNELPHNAQLDLQLCGWSRGAVANFRLLHKLNVELPAPLKAKINRIESFNIDPVCGGPSDRGRKLTQLRSLTDDNEFTRKIDSTTFYSDTGGVHVSHHILKRTPFFSALADPTRGHELFAFAANHEEIAGVKDRTSVSVLIKSYIKHRGKQSGFLYANYEELAIDTFIDMERPASFTKRGFLFADHKRASWHHRHIGVGGASLSEEELSRVKGPKACAKFLYDCSVLRQNGASCFNTAQLFKDRSASENPGVCNAQQLRCKL